MNPPVFPDPGDELFSSLLEEEDKPPDVFSDLSTVLVSTDLCGAMGGWRRRRWCERGGKIKGK